jgi:hypothetical protein
MRLLQDSTPDSSSSLRLEANSGFPAVFARRGALLRQLERLGWPTTDQALTLRRHIIAQIADCTRALRQFDAACAS